MLTAIFTVFGRLMYNKYTEMFGLRGCLRTVPLNQFFVKFYRKYLINEKIYVIMAMGSIMTCFYSI